MARTGTAKSRGSGKLSLKYARKSRRRKLKKIDQRSWSEERKEKFERSIRFAAAAKSYRVALNVTQVEVAQWYGVCGPTVTHWESGAYFGWDVRELNDYQRGCDRIAGVK